jgi:hypothetical protein
MFTRDDEQRLVRYLLDDAGGGGADAIEEKYLMMSGLRKLKQWRHSSYGTICEGICSRRNASGSRTSIYVPD